MYRRAVLALIAVVSSSAPSQAQNDPALAARIGAIINRPEFRHALWGIQIFDTDAGRTVYALNEDKLFTPGSTTKLLSAGTALAKLGATQRFSTKVYRTGAISPSGTLAGDLVLVASGDPNLSQRMQPDGSLAFENHDHSYGGASDTKAVPGDPVIVIRQLAAQVAAKGIKRITGRVLVDVSLYAEGTRELGTGVVVSPISVNDNVIDITVAPAATRGVPAQLVVSPMSRYLRIVNKTRTVPADSASALDWDDSVSADGSVRLTITGTIPLGKAGVLHSYAVPSPSKFAAMVLTEALASAGVVVAPQAKSLPANFAKLAAQYAASNLVAEHLSAPATEMVKVVLKVSQNMHASSLPLLMGALYGTKGQNGFDVEREWLQSEGLDTKGAQQADGAGGDAHFTPAFMISYLQMMSRRADFAAFKAALPVLGKDGTLYNIQPQSPAAGHVFAKTGTFALGDPLNRGLLVTGKGLAGYAETASGRHLIICVYVNNVFVSSAPDEVTRVIGQALGEVAATTWDIP